MSALSSLTKLREWVVVCWSIALSENLEGYFTSSVTSVVESLHRGNISAYFFVLRNEFVSIDFDYLSDPLVELNTLVTSIGVDGVVTDYPATANAYLRSPCADPNNNSSSHFLAVIAGDILSLVAKEALPPATSPAPSLTIDDVDSPPFPSPFDHSAGPSGAPKFHSGSTFVRSGVCLMGILVLFLRNALI